MTQQNISYPKSKLGLYVGSAAFLACSVLITFFIAPIVIACAILPFSMRYRVARVWAILVLKIAEIFCGVRYKVEGLEHVNRNEAAVVLSNHQSAWETLAFRCFLPPQTSLFKQSLLWIPFWGWAMSTLKPIAIDRNNKQSALRKLIKHGTEALNEGLWVVVFPEGTRMPAREIKSFSAGGAMLAQKSGYPVIPVAHNAGNFWPRYSFIKYPGTITVKIGPPIVSTGRKAGEINKQAEEWVVQAVNEMNA